MIPSDLAPMLEQFHKCLVEVADAELRMQGIYHTIDKTWHELQMAQLRIRENREVLTSLSRELWIKLVEAGVLTNPCPEYKPGGGLARPELASTLVPGQPRQRVVTMIAKQEEEA